MLLDVLLDAMAGGDEFLRSVSRAALLAGLTDPEVIRYRQDVLPDCALFRYRHRAHYRHC